MSSIMFIIIADNNISLNILLTNTSFKEISAEHPDIEMGGAWHPPYCQSPWRIAIILPIRDREDNLRIFIRNIIPFLKRQKADLTLYAVEQVSERDTFLNNNFKFLQTTLTLKCLQLGLSKLGRYMDYSKMS